MSGISGREKQIKSLGKELKLSDEWVYISVDLNGLKWEDRVIKLNVQPAAVGNQ